MALHNIDMDSVIRRIADRRIEEAMQQGKFDNLAGAGRPLNLEPLPADENARTLWWALKIMKNSNVTPDEVQWRKRIDLLREKIDLLADEAELAGLVDAVNELVCQINTLGTNAIKLPVAKLDLQTEIGKLRERSERC